MFFANLFRLLLINVLYSFASVVPSLYILGSFVSVVFSSLFLVILVVLGGKGKGERKAGFMVIVFDFCGVSFLSVLCWHCRVCDHDDE